MQKEQEIIKCPVCGAEYLPSEIFYPNNFLGKPENIIKTKHGELCGYLDRKYSDTETYTCDYCKGKLKVKVKFEFNVETLV